MAKNLAPPKTPPGQKLPVGKNPYRWASGRGYVCIWVDKNPTQKSFVTII